MKNQIIILALVLGLAALFGAGVLYAYNYYATEAPPPMAAYIPPVSKPDDSVLAGPVQSVSGSSVTIIKQDGVSVTLGIASSTKIFFTGPKAATTGDMHAGAVVLITPSTADAKVADSIVIVPPAPAAK